MIVFSESSPQLPPSASVRDIQASTEAARLAGARIYGIPQEFEPGLSADDALWHVPPQEAETPGVWIGYIPSPERYAALYEAALLRNIRLLNSPEEHLNAQEMDRALPLLGDLTPCSLVVRGQDECRVAVQALGLPLFVKGSVQSRKARGWKACVAETKAELETLVTSLLQLENRSRGRILVRELVFLRHSRFAPEGGFPLGREYRVFLYNAFILGLGYYWEGEDPLRTLTAQEESAVRDLAIRAAKQVGTPYVAVDIGQKTDNEWIVIEAGDAQFSGFSQVSPLSVWNGLAQILK